MYDKTPHWLSSPNGIMRFARHHPPLSREEEKEMIANARTSKSARQALFLDNLRHVTSLVVKYRHYDIETEDLLQAGIEGLLIGIEKIDPNYDNRACSFVVHRVVESMHREIRKNNYHLKSPDTTWMRKLFYSFKNAKTRVISERQRWLTVEQAALIAQDNDATVEQVFVAERFMDPDLIEIDAPVDDDKGEKPYPLTRDSDDVEAVMIGISEKEEAARIVEGALAKLTDKQRLVVQKRCLLEEPVILEEISAEMGVTKQRVQQIEVIGRNKIKAAIESAHEV